MRSSPYREYFPHVVLLGVASINIYMLALFRFVVARRNKVAFVYEQSSLHYKWKGYGIELLFESHSLSSDISQCKISISMVFSRQCLLPRNSHLVSGLFQIDCQSKFNKPVTIKIQHCNVKRKLSDLCFVTSSDENSPYKCQYVEGDFDSNFGEIKVSSFSVYGIIMRPIVSLYETIRNFLWPVTSGLLYSIYLYYNFSEQRRHCWKLTFIVVKNLDIYLTYVEDFARRNNIEKSVVRVVEFDESEEINFRACIDETPDVQLEPMTLPSLSKRIINKYEEGNPPICELILTSSRLPELPIKFCIEGIRNSHEHITFVWNRLGKSTM